MRHRAKLVALRSGLNAQLQGVLAKQALLPERSDVFLVAGMAWPRSAPLDLVYRQRVNWCWSSSTPTTARWKSSPGASPTGDTTSPWSPRDRRGS